MLPLIRVNITYFDERQQCNAIRLGQQFSGEVANPEDMFKYKSVSDKKKRRVKVGTMSSDDEDDDDGLAGVDWADRAEDLIDKYFEKYPPNQLNILSAKALTEGVTRYVGGDIEAVDMVIE